MDRKPQAHYPSQERYLEVIKEVDGATWLADIAEYFDVSEATARRKLDGLVAQGKLVKPHPRVAYYSLPELMSKDPA